MTEAIRLVIWDLDETFWGGTLSEGGVAWREGSAEIVRQLARRGVMSAICSKNDIEPVRAILAEKGLWDCFIFPSIDWSAKGPRIARLIETIGLRAASVLFIDDNPLNLAEARAHAPDIQTADERAIPTLLADPRLAGKNDAGLSRLKQYKVLETRKADEARFAETRDSAAGDAARDAGSNTEFLRASDIRIRIETDVEAHLDRAIELINRTNQLNFVKRRLPESIEEARARLRAEIARFDTQAGLVSVADRYGDHGLCGYYQVRTWRGAVELSQFCFSCRILGMGIEAFVYQRLGRPALKIEGEVLSDPAAHPDVDWVRLGGAAGGPGGDSEAEPSIGSVAIRGGCVLWPLVHYFGLSSEKVVGEFNTVREGKLVGLDHSLCLRHAIEGLSEEALTAIAPFGFRPEDFHTRFFDHSGEKPLWLFSSWIDVGWTVLRHRRTGVTIPYLPPRNSKEEAAHAGLAEYIAAEFEPLAYGQAEFEATMKLIFSRIPAHGLMFVLRLTEHRRRPNGEIQLNQRRHERNEWLARAARGFANVRLLSVGDFVDDETEALNERLTHFHRKVYHRLYEHVRSEAEASLREAGSAEGSAAGTDAPVDAAAVVA